MAVRKKREHGDHAQAVEPGALMLAMLFLRLLSQNSMCPAMLPKPPSTRKRPCGAHAIVLREPVPKSKIAWKERKTCQAAATRNP